MWFDWLLRGFLLSSWIAACSGCSRSELVPAPDRAPLAERCGAPAPVHLLPLEPGAMVNWDERSVVSHLDRWLIGVRSSVAIDDFRAEHDLPTGDERIVSVAECGGDERTVATGVDTVMVPPAPDAPWFACVPRAGGLTWIDPAGDRLQQPVPTSACALAWIDGEVVFARDESDGTTTLVAARFDELGAISSAEPLVERLRSWRHRSTPPAESRVGPEPTGQVYVLDEDNVLSIVDVRARNTTPLRADVTVFDAFGRYVVWFTPPSVMTPQPGQPGPEAYVLDVDTGAETQIAHYYDRLNHGPFFGPGTVTMIENDVANGYTASVTLDDMTYHSMAGGMWRAVAVFSNRMRILSGSADEGRGLFWWLPASPAEHTEYGEFFDGPLAFVRAASGSSYYRWVLAWEDDGAVSGLLSSGVDGDPRQTLARYEDPSLAKTVVLDGVYRPLRVSATRWATVRPDAGESGPLEIAEQGDSSGLLVDHRVHMEFASLQGGSSRARDLASPTILYMVTDSSRRGLWLAELAD